MDRAEVMERITILKMKCGKKWPFHYFNNFHANLPYGFRRSYDESTLQLREEGFQKGKNASEFFQDIDKALLEEGIDFEEIKKLQERHMTEELDALALPAYLRLIESGYTEDDLNR